MALIESILRDLRHWGHGVRVAPARAPPESVAESCCDVTFPACHGAAKRRRDYDTEPVCVASKALAEEDGLRERVNVRGSGGLVRSHASSPFAMSSGPAGVHLDASTPVRIRSSP